MKRNILSIFSVIALLIAATSCSDDTSYADLLNDENKLVNAFLAEHRVFEEFPGVENCEVGKDAPYYRVDEEGNVYMQVLQLGDGTYPDDNQHVYFRYTSYDLNYYVVGSDDNIGSGNADAPGATLSTFFLFNNYTIEQSSQYGTGLQIPVKLLGFNSKANVVIKSQAGPTAYMSYVVPFLYEVSYYPAASN